MYVLLNVKTVSFNPASLFELLLLLSGDIEACPGPTPREIPELDKSLKAKGLHIFHENLRGLLSNKEGFRSDSDTRKQGFRLWNFFKIPGFDFVSKPRQNGSGGRGRVGIYTQNHLIWKRRSDLERDEIEGIVVEIRPEKAKSFYIFVMRRPPNSSKSLHSKFNAVFPNLLSQLSLKECIFLGDSNVSFLKRSDNCESKSILHSLVSRN